jgi:hypothetical protein
MGAHRLCPWRIAVPRACAVQQRGSVQVARRGPEQPPRPSRAGGSIAGCARQGRRPARHFPHARLVSGPPLFTPHQTAPPHHIKSHINHIHISPSSTIVSQIAKLCTVRPLPSPPSCITSVVAPTNQFGIWIIQNGKKTKKTTTKTTTKRSKTTRFANGVLSFPPPCSWCTLFISACISPVCCRPCFDDAHLFPERQRRLRPSWSNSVHGGMIFRLIVNSFSQKPSTHTHAAHARTLTHSVLSIDVTPRLALAALKITQTRRG